MILESVRKNKISSFLVVSLFIIVIMAGVYAICMASDLGIISIPIAMLCGIGPALISYFNCDKMVLALNNARPATREQDLLLSDILDNLCIASGLPRPKLYVIEENAPNAFATGRNPNTAVICVTTGLLKKLDKYELEGVVAHELSHIKNYDILLSTVVSVFVGFVLMLSDFFLRSSFRSSRRNSNGGNLFAIISVIFLILSPIFATFMQLLISRKREYLADANAVEITRNPQGLIDALTKISTDTDAVVDSANKSTANMYIINPLKKAKDNMDDKSDLWSTHPSTKKRIEALKNIH